MIINKYDMYYKQDNQRYALFNKNQISNLYHLTIFLMWRFCYFKKDGILNFIEKHKNGIGFEELNIDIDNQTNLVYLSESWHEYKDKATTSEIEQLLEEENFIQLCKIGFLNCIIMTKDNFIHLLFTWDKILNELPPFALLYLDDKDWYDVKSFESEEEMKEFIAEHTQK